MSSKNAATKRKGGKKGSQEPVPDFDVFCADAQLEQRRLHHTVPDVESRSFAYFQWRHVAAGAFAATYGVEATADASASTPVRRKRGRPRASASPSASSSVSAVPAENPVTGAMSAQLLYTLAEGQYAATAPEALKRARAEPFPMPQANTADAEALLAMSELTIRMSLLCSAESGLTPMVGKVRSLIKLFIERGVVGRARRGYPAIAFLMDLLSLRMIVANWEQLDSAARAYVVHEMEGFSGRIRGSAVTSLQGELASMRATGRDLDTGRVNQLIAELAAQVPYDFPRACHDALCDALQRPALPAPSGQLLFPDEGDEENGDEESEEDVVVEVATVAPKTRTAAAAAATGAATAQTSHATTSAHVPHPVLSVITPPRPTVPGRTGSAAPTAGSGRQCTSKYHKRYSSEAAHASSLCQFCVVCHLLEILFNGFLTNCAYNHWPTTGKIRYNLRRFPQVQQLALARLEKSERGESLKEGVQIPL